MDSGRIYFDPSCHGNMLFLRNGENIFRGSGRSVLNLEETSKKRPFFSSPDEVYEEEYYDELSPEKKRRLSPEQVHMLEKSFEEENKLEPDRKTQLAKKLGLQPRQVAVWFQNRRARWKTKQLERDYDRLKSSYDSLVSDYESIAKENEKLKIEVVSLTDKLENKAVVGVAVSNELFDSPPLDAGDIPDLELNMKVEDHLSTGSGGSAVVDDHDGPQLVDSGDSYFPNDDYTEYVAPIDQSEEDDGSDDGGSYFSNVLAEADQQHHHHREEEPMPWWVWP